MSPLARQSAVWTLVALALLATLALYTRPDFLVQLADQLWSCF